MEYEREELQAALRKGVGVVTFEKNDGNLRVMKCTLSPDLLPKITKEVNGKHPENLDVLHVWDVEKAAWRSFRIDSVVEFGMDKLV